MYADDVVALRILVDVVVFWKMMSDTAKCSSQKKDNMPIIIYVMITRGAHILSNPVLVGLIQNSLEAFLF